MSPKDSFSDRKIRMHSRTIRIKARPQKKRGFKIKRQINFQQLDRACELFWKERGMTSPGTTHVGIESFTNN